jgi:Ca2+-binding EF-hand superfamily protein
MGNKGSKGQEGVKLSPEIEKRIEEVFALYDTNKRDAIDKQEAVNLWMRSFGSNITTDQFFDTDTNVDKDGGEISLEEFKHFWCVIKQSGHTEEEILEKLSHMDSY